MHVPANILSAFVAEPFVAKKRPQCRGLQGVHLRIRLFKKVEIYIKQNQKIDKKEN